MSEFEARNISPDNEDIRRNSISESSEQPTDSYLLIPYGFQPKTCYKPKAKSKEITEGKKRIKGFSLQHVIRS